MIIFLFNGERDARVDGVESVMTYPGYASIFNQSNNSSVELSSDKFIIFYERNTI